MNIDREVKIGVIEPVKHPHTARSFGELRCFIHLSIEAKSNCCKYGVLFPSSFSAA